MRKTRSGLPKHCTYEADPYGNRRVRFRRRGVSTYLTGIPWSDEFTINPNAARIGVPSPGVAPCPRRALPRRSLRAFSQCPRIIVRHREIVRMLSARLIPGLSDTEKLARIFLRSYCKLLLTMRRKRPHRRRLIRATPHPIHSKTRHSRPLDWCTELSASTSRWSGMSTSFMRRGSCSRMSIRSSRLHRAWPWSVKSRTRARVLRARSLRTLCTGPMNKRSVLLRQSVTILTKAPERSCSTSLTISTRTQGGN
jgi:hypothetical protein